MTRPRPSDAALASRKDRAELLRDLPNCAGETIEIELNNQQMQKCHFGSLSKQRLASSKTRKFRPNWSQLIHALKWA
jgi:hypothetical protein